MKPFMIYSVGREPEQFKHSGCVPIAIDAIFPLVFVLIITSSLLVVVSSSNKNEALFFSLLLHNITLYIIYIPLFSVVTTTVCNSYKKNTS